MLQKRKLKEKITYLGLKMCCILSPPCCLSCCHVKWVIWVWWWWCGCAGSHCHCRHGPRYLLIYFMSKYNQKKKKTYLGLRCDAWPLPCSLFTLMLALCRSCNCTTASVRVVVYSVKLEIVREIIKKKTYLGSRCNSSWAPVCPVDDIGVRW